MFKTLLVLCGVLVVSTSALKAQHGHSFAGRSSFANRGPLATARPSAYRGSNHFGGSGGYRGHGHYHGHSGRYYYLGGVPYFYPFGYGFGYPYYYGGFYGGFGDGYGYGGYPYNNGAYNGRVVDNDNDNDNDNGEGRGTGGSLPEAVQRQLAKRGYYKGSVDGQFGPASRSALSRFQKKQGLKETGKIDEPTLQALGFTGSGH